MIDEHIWNLNFVLAIRICRDITMCGYKVTSIYIYGFSASYLLKTVDNQRYTQSLAAALITEVLK